MAVREPWHPWKPRRCRRNRTPTPSRAEAGRAAEAQAVAYLQRQGLKLLRQNYRCAGGEIDALMEHGTELVVVEVRYRRAGGLLDPLESITAVKRQRIIHASRHFLCRHPDYFEWPLRFDVIALSGCGERVRLRWLPAAFDSGDS